ncbi:hypothetical protein BH24CHL5_BH24CHL5_08330 [soil metagenome]
MSLAIHLLGRPFVERDGVRQSPPRGQKAWALLCLMVLSERPSDRRQLAELLFDEADDPLGALRWNLARLRAMLQLPDAFSGDPIRVALSPDAQVDVQTLTAGTWVDTLRLPGLGRELLEGVDVAGSLAFDAWLQAERRRIVGLSAAVLREAATARLAGGDAGEAVALATRLVAIDEYDEDAHALLIRAYVAAGDNDRARHHLQSTSDRFRRELGIETSIALVRSAEGITADGPAQPAAGLAHGTLSSARSLMQAGEAAVGAGATEAGLETLRRAVADARDAGDEALLGRALVVLGTSYIHGARGRNGEGTTTLHTALATAESIGARDVISEACRELGYVELLRAEYDRATMWLERAIAEAPDESLRVPALGVMGSVISDRGQTAQAIELQRSVADRARALEKPRLAAWSLTFLGRTHVIRGEFDEACVVIADAQRAIQSAGWITFKPFAESIVGEIELARGDVDGASAAFESAFALGCQIGDPCWEGLGARGIGLVHMARGNATEAVRWLDDSRVRSIRISDTYMWIHAYCLDSLCSVAVTAGLPEARRWVSDLESIAARSGMSEMLVRAMLHRVALGDESAMESARLFGQRIDNPTVLGRLGEAVTA